MTLGFTAIGVLMVTTGGTADRVKGTFAVAVSSVGAVVLLTMLIRDRPVLVVGRDGLHVPLQRPLDVQWEQVVDVLTFKASWMSPRTLAIFVWPAVLEEYRKSLPTLLRLMGRVMPKAAQWRLFVPIQMLAVPPEELAEWIGTQVDARAAVPSELYLMPGDEVSPVWGLPSGRPVALTKLRLSVALENQLISWARRAGVPFELEMNGDDPGPGMADLVSEGQALSTRLELEMGVGHTVLALEELHH